MSTRLQWFLFGILVVIGFLVAWEVGAIPRHVAICIYNERSNTEECVDYPILLGFFWYIAEGLNYFGGAITALATLIIAIFTRRLFKATAGLKESTDKLWTTTTTAAKVQEDDTRVLQRAYLEARRGGIDVTIDNQVIGQVVFFNAGALPARKVTVYAKIMWSESRDADEFSEAQIPPRALVLPAKSELPTGTGILEGGRGRLNQGRGYIFVWGRATYDDGFDKPRWLIFCHRYNCGSPKPGDGGISERYGRMHHHHNDGN
jgi:hypothetical protein